MVLVIAGASVSVKEGGMCPLCSSSKRSALDVDEKRYWHCAVCDLRYVDPVHRLAPVDEKERYHLHEAGDEGYLRFVAPLVERLQSQAPKGTRGLDFGAGQFPVLSSYIRGLGYSVDAYDPFFWPGEVKGPYDFIVTCEVVEHLYEPAKEFTRFKEWLRPGGALVIQTELVTEKVNFANWYYRRDPTHVVFYSEQSFRWIETHLGFRDLKTEGRVISMRVR